MTWDIPTGDIGGLPTATVISVAPRFQFLQQSSRARVCRRRRQRRPRPSLETPGRASCGAEDWQRSLLYVLPMIRVHTPMLSLPESDAFQIRDPQAAVAAYLPP